ncbi:PREDICTED: natural killer cell receptor 2B4-like [Calidris pugnax]|uniref:natural killer cell receptor 2B4-like n=1 Tax=Calidris pugnax TaxID=198806 RepID=UPI00071C886C|nr:PREDICTED: natural killer cell receptor 2B4-like [Calidris pugnax]
MGYPVIPPRPPQGNAPRRRVGLWGGGCQGTQRGRQRQRRGAHRGAEGAKEPQAGEEVTAGHSHPAPGGGFAPLQLQGAPSGAPPEMGCPGGPRCLLTPMLLLLPFLVLVATADGQGSPKCQEKAVAAGGELRLVLEKPLQGWVKVEWRVRLAMGEQHRILTADGSKSSQPSNSPFLGRAFFHPENLSLLIPRVTTADSGLYRAEFEHTNGNVTSQSFCVSVWEPVAQPLLNTCILHREQDRCNLSLLCTVPGATNVSYSWSCTGGHPGALGHQPQLDLQLLGDSAPMVCLCNATNPLSWSTATIDVTAVCFSTGPVSNVAVGHQLQLDLQLLGDSDSMVCLCNATNPLSWSTATIDVTAVCHPAPGLPSWAVAVILLLALAISVAIAAICYRQKKRRKDPPSGQGEQILTVYEEVGKTRTGQAPPQNRTSQATVEGNTIYAVVTKTQGPSHRQEPETCTVYSMIQPSKRPPSLKRKRLDRALVSTAYVEATGGSRHWCPPLQTSAPGPAGHHLS